MLLIVKLAPKLPLCSQQTLSFKQNSNRKLSIQLKRARRNEGIGIKKEVCCYPIFFTNNSCPLPSFDITSDGTLLLCKN
jgi:hypothetical protein